MKKLISSVLLATIFFTVTASAQKAGRSERVRQYLVDSLGVSAANADSVVALSQRSMTQVRSIMQDQSLSQEEKKQKVKPIRQEMQTAMKKFLSDDQIAKLQEMQMQRRQNRNGNNKK